MSLRPSIGNMVSYPDPTTGELIFRPRTGEDGVLPGDRFGQVARFELNDEGETILTCPPDHEPHAGFSVGEFFEQLVEETKVEKVGRRIRVTIEVLDDSEDGR